MQSVGSVSKPIIFPFSISANRPWKKNPAISLGRSVLPMMSGDITTGERVSGSEIFLWSLRRGRIPTAFANSSSNPCRR